MILKVHVPGARCYEVGDEIWHEPLPDAIRAQAQIIAQDAASDPLEPPEQTDREALPDRVIAEMTAALVKVGDSYRRPTAFCTRSATNPRLISVRTKVTSAPWTIQHHARSWRRSCGSRTYRSDRSGPAAP